MVRQAVTSLPDATVVWLRGYFAPPWADAVAERTEEIGTAVLDFLQPLGQSHRDSGRAPLQGAVAGITYHSQGEGPPLVLLPLSLASSQWDPLLARLSAQYRTVTLGGPALGFLAILESRGHSAGYLRMVQQVMEAVHLRPGEVILDVGCGSGVLDRWLGRSTGQAMLNGVFHGIRGAVQRLVERYAESYGAYPMVIATGGDAEALRDV